MITAFGEALIDLIEQADGRYLPALGGSVSNFCVATVRQGVPLTYLNRLSSDTFGQRFAKLYADNGVERLHPQPTQRPTSLAVVSLDKGQPSYTFHREQVADREVDLAAITRDWPAGTRILHTGCLMLVPDDIDRTLALLAMARAHGALISVDLNLRPRVANDDNAYRQAVRRAMAAADIVKLSDEDLAFLCPELAPEQLNVDAAAALCLVAPQVRLLAYTRGAQGAALVTRGLSVAEPVPSNVRVVDTVGAGDCFIAALLAWLVRQTPEQLDALDGLSADTARQALRHAMAAAAINVARAGCQPATWEETLAAA